MNMYVQVTFLKLFYTQNCNNLESLLKHIMSKFSQPTIHYLKTTSTVLIFHTLIHTDLEGVLKNALANSKLIGFLPFKLISRLDFNIQMHFMSMSTLENSQYNWS